MIQFKFTFMTPQRNGTFSLYTKDAQTIRLMVYPEIYINIKLYRQTLNALTCIQYLMHKRQQKADFSFLTLTDVKLMNK